MPEAFFRADLTRKTGTLDLDGVEAKVRVASGQLVLVSDEKAQASLPISDIERIKVTHFDLSGQTGPSYREVKIWPRSEERPWILAVDKGDRGYVPVMKELAQRLISLKGRSAVLCGHDAPYAIVLFVTRIGIAACLAILCGIIAISSSSWFFAALAAAGGAYLFWAFPRWKKGCWPHPARDMEEFENTLSAKI